MVDGISTAHLEKDVNILHERTQETKAQLNTHEAVCQERYENILSTIDKYDDKIKAIHKEILELKTLATQGKTSLRTLFFIGTIVAAVIAALAAFSSIK